jgi:hypothetical protein
MRSALHFNLGIVGRSNEVTVGMLRPFDLFIDFKAASKSAAYPQ